MSIWQGRFSLNVGEVFRVEQEVGFYPAGCTIVQLSVLLSAGEETGGICSQERVPKEDNIRPVQGTTAKLPKMHPSWYSNFLFWL